MVALKFDMIYRLENGLAEPKSCEGEPAPARELEEAPMATAALFAEVPNGERAVGPECDSMGDVVAVEDPERGWAAGL